MCDTRTYVLDSVGAGLTGAEDLNSCKHLQQSHIQRDQRLISWYINVYLTQMNFLCAVLRGKKVLNAVVLMSLSIQVCFICC